MADKGDVAAKLKPEPPKPDLQWKIVGGLVGLAVGFASRKALTYGWEKATGRKPPSSADSLDISLGEAIAYAVVMGLGMEVARIVATRAAAKRWQSWKSTAQSAADQLKS